MDVLHANVSLLGLGIHFEQKYSIRQLYIIDNTKPTTLAPLGGWIRQADFIDIMPYTRDLVAGSFVCFRLIEQIFKLSQNG